MNKFDYKNLTPFKWFVLENFPFIEADFDALTEWQLFCKLGKEINKIIDSQNVVGEQAETLTNAFNNLKNYVDNYFNNLDVQDEINNKLNQMAEDGTLTQMIGNYIQPLIDAQNEKINLIEKQVSSAVSGNPIVANSILQMTDTSKIYVNTSDGNWYYYNGTAWTAGGIYQSTSFTSLTQNTPISLNIQGYVGKDGIINKTEGFSRSNYIEVNPLSFITGKLRQVAGKISLIAFYDENKTFIGNYIGTNVTEDHSFNQQLIERTKYIIVSSYQVDGINAYVNINAINYINNVNDKIEKISSFQLNIVGYVGKNGIINKTEGFSRTDYIPVSFGERVNGYLRNTHQNLALVSFYDSSKRLLSLYTGENDTSKMEYFDLPVPSKCKYVIFSSTTTSSTHPNIAQKYVNALNWKDTFNTLLSETEMKNKSYLVDKSISQNTDYSFNSLIDCLNHIESLNLNEVVNVYIKAGTYDILEELGGTDFLSSLTPDSSAYDIQPWLYNVNIKGLGNVKLVYKPSLALASQYPLAASLISPINIRGNVNIENIEIECQYCRYAIHDETGGNPKYNNTYHNYKNIKASHLGKLSSAIGGQAFGAGFDNGQSYNFENCYFKSISDNALSFHNRESNGANINITNSIFITETSPSIRFGNVGTQGKTIINLSNSHLNNGLLINAESSAIPSSNAYAIYSLNCNDFNINISKDLGVNPYDPIVF